MYMTIGGRKTRKNRKRTSGGASGFLGALGLNAPVFEKKDGVSLSYNSKAITCDVCSNNNYLEIQSSINKSKVRGFVRDAIFGEDSGEIDNTSITLYVCQTCGYCKIVRNNGKQLIVSGPVAAAAATSG